LKEQSGIRALCPYIVETEGNGGGNETRPLKSKTLTDRRTVPLMTELVEELRDHRAKLAEWGRAKPAAWVISTEEGGHITYAGFAVAFAGRSPRPALRTRR
jgi:hypothetical protein